MEPVVSSIHSRFSPIVSTHHHRKLQQATKPIFFLSVELSPTHSLMGPNLGVRTAIILLPLSRKGCRAAVFLKSPFTNSRQTEYSSFFSCLARPPATPRRPRLPAPHFPHMPPPAVQTATTLALPFSPALLPRDVH